MGSLESGRCASYRPLSRGLVPFFLGVQIDLHILLGPGVAGVIAATVSPRETIGRG